MNLPSPEATRLLGFFCGGRGEDAGVRGQGSISTSRFNRFVMSIKSHRDLKVWQRGMDLAEEVYALTQDFPADERFGLISQLRRAIVSIPANIAEGHARSSTKEYLRFLSIALGSLAEVETFLELAQRLQMANQDQIADLLDDLIEERKMLRSLQASLNDRLSAKLPTP